jgi:hypothetical protein
MNSANTMFNHYIHDMNIGDKVWILRGRTDVLYTGIVTSDCYFTSNPKFEGYNHRRNITMTSCSPGTIVSNGGYMMTICKIDTNKVHLVNNN